MYRVKARMKRGGCLCLDVYAKVYNNSDGAGQKWVDVDLLSIQWPHGGEVAEKNIASMDEFKTAIIEAAESASQCALEDAMERTLEDR